MIALPLLLALAGDPPDARVDFAREVRPILSDRCFACHGPDEAARRFTGGLRLDTREGALADLGGYAAVVPGDVAASELLARVRAERPEDRMPPPDSKLELDERELRLLERWIAEGAEYRAHWAFEPARRREPPPVSDPEWARDPLDRWVLAGLDAAGLAPAAEASRELWLRRVSLDLCGLPPTVEELETFAADARSDAFERAVDRLLASPRHAERMTASWLDLARYSDTWGYQSDVERAVWPWRDWVLRAYAQNLPYDDFVTWQLAGDLLPDAGPEQRLATAFLRLHRMTNEGGSVEEEFRVESVADRVHTVGTAFLGLTLECARCHDHKFDPISTAEYYSLFALLQDVDECGLYSHFTGAVPTPALDLPSDEQRTEIERLVERVAELEEEVARLPDERQEAFANWLGDEPPAVEPPGEVGRYALDGVEDGGLANTIDPARPGRAAEGVTPTAGVRGGGLLLTGDAPASFPGVAEVARWDPFTVALWVRAPRHFERAVVLHRSRAWTDAGSQGWQLLIEDGRLSAALIHFWPGDAIAVQAVAELPVAEWVHVALRYDGSGRAAGLTIAVDGRPAELELVRDSLTRAITGGGPPALTIGERFRDRGFAGGEVDELRVFERALSDAELALLPENEAAPARDLSTFLAAHDPRAAEARAALREARRALGEARDRVPQIVTMRALEAPREAFVLRRGAYDRPGDAVDPGTPAALPPLPAGAPRDRLGLARWLFAPEQPLTARVAANRLWELAFGRGLVETAEDFGSQGTPPSHPELLDALALDLVESGWDQRALLRRLVLSSTYRQGSRVDAATRARDPDGRLFSRVPARRLEAEMLRDAALFSGGLLVEQQGGPPVKPYQPAGLWREKSGATYVPDSGPGLWRRSLYTYWKRTSPPPTMMLFDAAKRDVCVARRRTTTSPLQLLALWNDPQFVEAARALAARAMREAPDGEAWIARAFELATARVPEAAELEALGALFDAERAAFEAAPERAAALLAVGEAEPDPDLAPATLAAGALVASAILSSDAFAVRR